MSNTRQQYVYFTDFIHLQSPQYFQLGTFSFSSAHLAQSHHGDVPEKHVSCQKYEDVPLWDMCQFILIQCTNHTY